MGRMPGIACEVAGRDFGREPPARFAKAIHIQLHVAGAIRLEIICAKMKKPYGGPKPTPILGMDGSKKLLLQMDERARDLNQAFEKALILIMALEP
jgi:hypothetical protein